MTAHASLALLSVLCLVTSVSADGSAGRTLFDFRSDDAAAAWVSVNDGVMGGRSEGTFAVTDEHHLKFSGNLSLENNGGFASVRSQKTTLDLQPGETILLRVRGDGRKYSLNLYNTRRQTAFSYQADFPTSAGEWKEIAIGLDEFVATSYGRTVQTPLVPADIAGVGLLIADKKEGPFELEVDWIKILPAGEAAAE